MKKDLYFDDIKENEILIKSIIYSMKDINIICKKVNNKISLTFLCESIESFTDKIKCCDLKYILLEELLISIINQIKFLEKLRYTFYNIHPENIYIINKDIFVYIDDGIVEIIDNKIKIGNIFKKNEYCSPELFEISNLPSRISYKSIYFSISILLLKNLLEFDETLFYQLKIEDKIETKINILTQIDKILNKIKYTKLYFFIKKNINIQESKRLLLYI